MAEGPSACHVNGIGGCFLFSPEPARLAEWYADAFGLQLETYGETSFGVTFGAVDPSDPKRRLETVFSVMKAKVDLPGLPHRPDPVQPSDMYGDQPFMLNLRVDDLDALLTRLEARGVPILARQEEEYGRFAWIHDPERRRLELWEPGQPFTG